MEVAKALSILYGNVTNPTQAEGVEAWQALIDNPHTLFHLPKWFHVTAQQLVANGTCRDNRAR